MPVYSKNYSYNSCDVLEHSTQQYVNADYIVLLKEERKTILHKIC